MTGFGGLAARLLAGGVFAAAGCAADGGPPPAPINVAANADRLLARDLSDPGLRRFLAARGLADGSQAPWTLDALTAAAIWFDAGVAAARARWREAVVAETAAARGAPPALAPELAWDALEESPLTVGFQVEAPWDAASRKAARLALARAETDAFAFAAMRLGWKRRAAVRRAAVACHAADSRLAGARARRGVLERIAELHERRRALGEAGIDAVSRARRDVEDAARDEARAAGARETCRGALAAALGAPVAAAAPRIDAHALERATARPAPAADARRAALMTRLDIREALGRYAAAEARLTLAIARRRPGFTLEPGLFWNPGGAAWSLGSQIGLGWLFDDSAPVREAAAARETAARAVLARQAAVLAELSAADAALAAARLRVDSAAAAARRAEEWRAVAEARRAGGETGRLAVLEAELGVAAARRAENEARLAVMAAAAAWEDAVERPLAGAPGVDPARLALTEPAR